MEDYNNNIEKLWEFRLVSVDHLGGVIMFFSFLLPFHSFITKVTTDGKRQRTIEKWFSTGIYIVYIWYAVSPQIKTSVYNP